jgi:hypothetical protein
MDLGGLVHQLIHDKRQEVTKHDLEDRTQTGHGGANRNAECAGFGDRRVDDALRAELREKPLRLFEHAARGSDVLA